MTTPMSPEHRSAEPTGRSREHDRIKAAYRYYDGSGTEQRKRDIANQGTRLNAETRWQAIERVLRGLNLRPGFRVLDVGCGAGQDLQRIGLEFADLRPSLHGIDLLPDRIERARVAAPSAVLHVGGAEQLPYPSQTFDVILAATMFSSILDDGVSKAVATEMTRVLSGGGAIVCYDMRYPNPWNPHTRALGIDQIRHLFPQASLRLHPVTLIPPLARGLGGLAGLAYAPLHSVNLLRSHHVVDVRPAALVCQVAPSGSGQQAPGRNPQDPAQDPQEQGGGHGRQQDAHPLDPSPAAPARAGHRPRRLAIHVAMTLGGLGCERALTFAAVTLILRSLPSAQGGAFVLMLKVAWITGALTTLGLQTGAVRLISAALGEGRDRWAAALLRAFLAMRLVMAIVLIAGAFLAGGWIADKFLGNPSVAGFVEWGCVSAATNTLLMFTLHHLQARQSFGKYTVLTIMSSAARLSAVMLMLAAGLLSAYRAALIWALLPAVAAVAGIFLAPRAFLARMDSQEVRRARSELIKLGRWLTVSALILVLSINLDSLLVVRYLGLPRADLYGAAVNLSLVVVMLATASFTVLLPAISRLTQRRRIRRFFYRSLLVSSVTAIILLPVNAAAPWLVGTVYGARFLPAVPAFRWLFGSALLTIVSTTLGVVFLALRRPIHMAGQALAQVAVALPCYLVLIPREGILGGAIGTFSGQAVSLLYVLFVAPLLLRGSPESTPEAGKPGYAT